MMRHVAILGAGMFGTALANILAENGHEVRLWSRDVEQARSITMEHENKRSLPGFRVYESILATADLEQALAGVDICFVAVPSRAFRQVVRSARPFLPSDAGVVTTTKGIEADGFHLMSSIIRDELDTNPVGVLSGPNLAVEIAQRQITATVIASDSADLRAAVQDMLHTAYFRVYSSEDMFGVELAGALKNIYAIAAGFAAAMGVGQNTQGMLLTRSLAEMSRFAHSMGAKPITFLGLAGVGDLMVTCGSPLSRNYQIGYSLGEGLTLEQAVEKLGRLAEGINTIRTVKHKAEQLGVYMPIVNGLYSILFEQRPVAEVIDEIMMGEQPSDVEFVTGE